MSSNPVESTSLWSVDHRQQIEAAIEAHKEQQPYAVFDADNTIWKYDITEGLLAHRIARDHGLNIGQGQRGIGHAGPAVGVAQNLAHGTDGAGQAVVVAIGQVGW